MLRAARTSAVAVLSLCLGCASFEAAQLYASGTQALDQGRVAQAIVELERAAELQPAASEIQNHLGLAYRAAGRDQDARGAFERAVALDCRNAAASHNLQLAEMEARFREEPP